MAHVEPAEGSVNAMAAPLSHPDQAQLSAKHFQATFALLASFTLLPSLRRFIFSRQTTALRREAQSSTATVDKAVETSRRLSQSP